jgi:hypothetical protein
MPVCFKPTALAVLLWVASAAATSAGCDDLDTTGADRCETHEHCIPGHMCVDGQCVPITWSAQGAAGSPPMSRRSDAAPPGPTDAGHDASTDAGNDASTDAGHAASTVDAGHDASTVASDAAPVSCSDEQPPQEAPCPVHGELCARWTTDETTGYDRYFACQCRPQTSTSWVWDCYEGTLGRCPHVLQNDGDSCFGYADQTCPYPPKRTCDCPAGGDDLRWQCFEEPPALEAPATIAPDKLVRDLTGEERQSWCAWFIDATVPPGQPLPLDLPADESGFYPSTGCLGCPAAIGIQATMPFPVPASACVANLELTTCGATIAHLTDCIRSLFSGCFLQGEGCAAFFETPGCSGTIVNQGGDCRRLKVE